MTDVEAPSIDFGWDRIVGHAATVAALRRATSADLPHPAYLIFGPNGIGKTLIAHTVAAALVCESDPALRPCRTCGPCNKVFASSHTDVWTELPTGRSHTITVDQVSDVQRRLGFRRLEGRHRVVLILGAGTMNEHAQNKLLKTLEEPPDGTVIVLTTKHPGLMLPTVRSRCQKLSLGAVAADPLAQWLVSRHGADPAAATVAAAASGGLPGRALELLEPERAAERSDRVAKTAAALSGDSEARRTLIKAIDRDREGAREVVSLMQELLRDAMAAATGLQTGFVHPDAVPSPELVGLGADQLARLMLTVEDVQNRLVRNVHPGGMVEDFLRRVRDAS